MRLKERVALITGAGGGLGTAVAKRLASEGASVVCADRNFQAAENTVSEIAGAGGTAISQESDASEYDQC